METYLLDFQELLIIIHPSSAKALEERLESGIENDIVVSTNGY